MLIKLIKYDIKSGLRGYVLPGVFMAGLFVAQFLANITGVESLKGLTLALSIFGTMACLALYAFVTVTHLYRQMCGKEAYLTYTIPVGTPTLILSKVICVVLWGLFTAAVCAAFWWLDYHLLMADEFRDLFDNIINGLREDSGWLGVIGSMILGEVFKAIGLLFFCLSLVNVPFLRLRNWGIIAAILAWFIIGQLVGALGIGVAGALNVLNELQYASSVTMVGNLFNVTMITNAVCSAGLICLAGVNTKLARSI